MARQLAVQVPRSLFEDGPYHQKQHHLTEKDVKGFSSLVAPAARP